MSIDSEKIKYKDIENDLEKIKLDLFNTSIYINSILDILRFNFYLMKSN